MNEDQYGISVTPSSIIWGRFNYAVANNVCDLNATISKIGFVERVCSLKLGFFLELKGTEPTDPVEVHALCGSNIKCEIIVSYKFGTCLRIEKKASCYILLADLYPTSMTPLASWSRYLFSLWPEQSLLHWYYILKSEPTCESVRQDEVFVMMPKTKNLQPMAHCVLLTPNDYGFVCTILPKLTLESGSSSSEVVQAINRLTDNRLVMQKFFSQTSPPLPRSMKRPEVFKLQMSSEMPTMMSQTAFQPTNVLNDVHLLTLTDSNYLLHEQMQGSTLTHYIPVMIISALLERFQYISRLLNLKSKSGPSEDAMLGQTLASTEEFLHSLCYKLSHSLDSNQFLKKSDSKRDIFSLPIPVNLQLYQVRVCEVTNMPTEDGLISELTQSRSFGHVSATGDNVHNADPICVESKELKQYSILTVGCPSPHGMEMGEKTSNGKSYNRFEELAKLNISISRKMLHAKSTRSTISVPLQTFDRQSFWREESGGVDSPDGGGREGRNNFFHKVLLRRDLMILSQMLTSLCAALVNALHTYKDDVIFWKLMMKSKKVNFAWTSFINDNGSEYEMLKDFLGAVSYVNTYVKFMFCEGDNNFYPIVEADILGDIIVKIEIPKSKGSLDSRSVFVSQFPADGSGKMFDCCVHFLNQRVIPTPSGADASSATNLIASKSSTLQLDIFAKVYKSFVEGYLGTTIKYLGCTPGQGLEAKDLMECQDRLERLLNRPNLSDLGARFPANINHVHDFIHAAHISRCIRLTSCKSAKDRTSMSSTLEMSKLITSFLMRNKYGDASGVPSSDVDEKETALQWDSKAFLKNEQVNKVVVDSLRRGVRLKNCKINIGRPRYKFTTFNYRYLPPEFKPPESTYTSSADTST